MDRDNPLMAMSNVLDSVCLAAEQSQMVQSMVQYISPEKQFREKYSFEERYAEADRILKKYPDRIPVICEQEFDTASQDIKKKYLVPRSMKISQFCFIIRRRMSLPAEKALFMSIVFENSDGTMGTVLAPTAHMMEHLHSQYRDRDKFMYIKCSTENVFG